MNLKKKYFQLLRIGSRNVSNWAAVLNMSVSSEDQLTNVIIKVASIFPIACYLLVSSSN